MAECRPPEPANGRRRLRREQRDRTASLRPFGNKADADAAVANIRARGRLRRPGHRQQPFSFRDPITGEITGFDVDIAGEVARRHLRHPSAVEYRILSSADRISALQQNTVDIVVKTMTITCSAATGELLHGVLQCRLPTHSGPAGVGDRGPRTCPGRVCVAAAPPRWNGCRDHPAADHRDGGDLGRLPGGTAAAGGRRGQHRRLDPGGLVAQDPLSASSARTWLRAGAVRHRHQSPPTPLVRFVNGTLDRIRHRRDVEHPLYRKWLTVLGPAPPPHPRYLD